jgi:hypothetical protein
MADVAGVLEKQGRQEEAEDGVKGLLALRERFLGSEHVDTRATRKFLALVGRRCDTEPVWTGVRPETLSGVKGGMLPVSVISESGQAKTVDGPSSVVASTVADGMLEGLWQDLPELEVLLELKFEEVMVLDQETCTRFVVKALRSPCLRSVDLR